ncbi:hypothetical protein ACQKWADRAFT_312781 [Trichoderma austrokoningii]
MQCASTTDPRPQALPNNDSTAAKPSRDREDIEEPNTHGTKRPIGEVDCNINLAAYEDIRAVRLLRLEDIRSS